MNTDNLIKNNITGILTNYRQIVITKDGQLRDFYPSKEQRQYFENEDIVIEYSYDAGDTDITKRFFVINNEEFEKVEYQDITNLDEQLRWMIILNHPCVFYWLENVWSGNNEKLII